MLQDISYNIDRKNFYVKSIYKVNSTFLNENNFSARENGRYIDGYNYSTMGVGLHVYGSNNKIILRGNILSKGYGGVGILVAYVKNHELNIDGVVTADGLKGRFLKISA